MKRLLAISSSLILATLSLSASGADRQIQDRHIWKRDAQNAFQGKAALVGNNGTGYINSQYGTNGPYLGFTVAWKDVNYCSDKTESFEEQTLIYVDGKPIKFELICYRGTWVNYHAKTQEGIKFIAKKLSNHSVSTVEFVHRFPNSKDLIYSMSTAGFYEVYNKIEISASESI